MLDCRKVIERLQNVSHYFKSMLKVGYDGDADIYREHRESVKMAAELLKDQQKQIEQMNFIYGFVYGGQVKEIKELVRCKDCRHCFVDGENVRFNVCELNHNKIQPDDWFCADGERRDADAG